MERDLIDFLSKYTVLSEEDIQIIKDQNLIKEYKKNTILLSEGQVSKECYLVLKGCLRSFYLIDGEEKTTAFYTENQPVTPVSYKGNPFRILYILPGRLYPFHRQSGKNRTVFGSIPQIRTSDWHHKQSDYGWQPDNIWWFQESSSWKKVFKFVGQKTRSNKPGTPVSSCQLSRN